jgi:hypothetical protein
MIIYKMNIMLNIQDDMARLTLRLIQKKSLNTYIRVCFLCLIIILKHICLMRQDIYGKQQDSEVKNPDLEAPALGYSWSGIGHRQFLLEYWSGGPPWCDLQGHTLGSAIY